jgi:hypothetical protein
MVNTQLNPGFRPFAINPPFTIEMLARRDGVVGTADFLNTLLGLNAADTAAGVNQSGDSCLSLLASGER